MEDDSSCVITAGLSLAGFPAVLANMFSRQRCGHCLMESSQHGWYHYQVTLPSLDNARLYPSSESRQVSWRALQMLHINTPQQILGDKHFVYKYFFFKSLRHRFLKANNLWLLSSHACVFENQHSALGNLRFFKLHQNMETKKKKDWVWRHLVSTVEIY